jgi:hypothetical protein
MTMLLKAMGSDAKRNSDLVHAVEVPPNPSIEGMPKRLRLLCTPQVKR